MRLIRHSNEQTPCGHAKDAIVRMILSRGYKVGDKLPTYRELAPHLGIALRTMERAMRLLADEGILQLLHGKGAFVRKVPAGGGRLAEVGLVYPASRLHLIRTSYLNEILSGLIIECDVSQIDLQIVAFRQAGTAICQPVPPRDLALRVDGMLLLGVVNEDYLAAFANEPIPLVLIDSQARSSPLYAVCVDNAGAIRQVMDHLYQLGHRRIAYADALSNDPLAGPGQPPWVASVDGCERREAYLAELQRLNLEYQHIYSPGKAEPREAAAALARRLARDRQRPSAIVTYDEPMAQALCQGLLAAGIRVPGVISVAGAVGVADGPLVGGLTITCSVGEFENMGRRAMAALTRQVTGRRCHRSFVERVGTSLKLGTSTASSLVR